MKRDPKAEITEGEIYGVPVPGGWPDRGPFQVLRNALGKIFGRRKSGGHAEPRRSPAGDSSEPKPANLSQHDPQK